MHIEYGVLMHVVNQLVVAFHIVGVVVVVGVVAGVVDGPGIEMVWSTSSVGIGTGTGNGCKPGGWTGSTVHVGYGVLMHVV